MLSVERTTTGVIIRQPNTDVKKAVLKYFSLLKPTREYFIYSGNDPNGKTLFGDEKDVIYITSGFLKIKDPVIQSLPRGVVKQPPMPAKIDLKVERSPRSQLQRDCIEKLTTSNSSKITVELKPGTGKLEPYSRHIPTPTEQGYTLMGDLKVGDYVFDRTGKLTKILKIFEHGVQDIYKVTFADGRIALCGLDHLWTVKSHKNGAWKTLMLRDMIGDFKHIKLSKLNNPNRDPYAYKYYIPMNKPVQYPKRIVSIDPWVLGCFIGDGCLTLPYLTISSGSDEIPNKIAEICGINVCKKSPKDPKDYSYIFKDKEGHAIRTDEFFKDYPELIDYSRHRSIPDDYLYNDVNTRSELLRGLMDTDGCITCGENRYNVTYSSTSFALLKDIQTLIYSLGYTTGPVHVDKRTDKYTENFCGSFHLRVPNIAKPSLFTVSYKHELAMESLKYDKDNRYDDLLIKDISYSHREKCRCIMVDNDEHLYLTEDYIVTHNTFIAMYSICKLGLKALIVAPTTLLKKQWIEEFIEAGIDEKDIAKKIQDAPKKAVCVVTISAIENELRDNWFGLLNILKESNFGIKIVDEAHLHLKGVLKFDSICNIKHNWYLSATLGRSDESEDSILNRALLDAERFIGGGKYEEYQKKYVNVIFQDVWYNPSQKLCNETFKFGSKGLVRSTYYNMLMQYKNGIPFITNIISLIKRIDNIKTYKGKTLVLLPLLETIDVVIQYIKNDPYFRNISYSGVDGSMPLTERKNAMECDLILATSMSMGTGVDVQNLAAVINFDQYSSPIINEQIVGRLRDRGKETWYVDICDHVKQARSIENWGRKRRNLIPYFPGVKPDIKLFPKIIC